MKGWFTVRERLALLAFLPLAVAKMRITSATSSGVVTSSNDMRTRPSEG